MSLTSDQKNYIKKNVRNLPVSKIAADLGISENDVLAYLKKKWSPKKYKKFMRGQFSAKKTSEETGGYFSFFDFFTENRLILAFLAILVFAVYANSLGNGFVSDDISGVMKNENIGRFSSVFAGPMHFSLWSFLQFIAFHIGGLHPATFRIINVLSHLGCVILIYLLLSLSMKKQVALIAATLFAVHPIFTESISWVSGGLYSVYAFFFLLSFLFYLFSEDNKRYFRWSIVFFILSILASEKALALFLVFALYELAFGSLKYNWKRIMPFFSISFFLLILYAAKIGARSGDVASASYQPTGGGLYNPLIQIPVAIGSYLKLMFWPAKLTLYQTEMSFSQGQYLILLSITFLFLISIIWSWRKNKDIFFWLCFFVITLLPTLTPLKISWIVAERYVYLGALGIIVAFAILFDKFLNLKNENAKMVGYFALVLIASSLFVRTVIRNQDWKSEDTLWISTAAVAPSGQQIHNNLGDVYARQKDYAKAIEEFQKAIEINPNYADAYHNLGNTYQTVGENEKAVENFQKALEINPGLWQSYQNLAAIFFSAGDFPKALEYIKKAAEINPTDENLKQNVQVIEAKAREK